MSSIYSTQSLHFPRKGATGQRQRQSGLRAELDKLKTLRKKTPGSETTALPVLPCLRVGGDAHFVSLC